jgi:TolA-binding protein
MRTRKRLTKQQLKRDRFVDTTFDWALWARENARTVAMVAVGVVVVLLAFVLYRTSEARESRQASQKFQEVMQTYSAGNFQLAANDLKQFISQYGGSRLADQARLYLANSYLLAGDAKSAAKTLEESRGELESGSVAYSAASLLGTAYESAGEGAKAAEAYGRAGQKAHYDFQRAEALMNQARAYATLQNDAKAVVAYRAVIDKYPESSMAKEAKVRLAELTARPLAGAPVVPVDAPPASDTTSGMARSPGAIPADSNAASGEATAGGRETTNKSATSQ